MLSHAQARVVISNAFLDVVGTLPTMIEAQTIQAIALGESSYGSGWVNSEKGQTCNNWGAVQAGRPPCGVGTFLYQDSRPPKKGEGSANIPYEACFRCYDTPEEGAAHVVRLLMTSKRARAAGTPSAIGSGNVTEVSSAMYQQGYYEGVCHTPPECVRWHEKGMVRRLAAVAKGLGEPVVVTLGRTSRTAGASGSGKMKTLLLLGGAAAILKGAL